MTALPTPTTRAEAIQRAIDTIEGRLSRHHNIMLQMEAGSENRTLTLVHIAQADAADVAMWTALAAVLPDTDPWLDRVRAAALAVVEAGADEVSPAADGIPQAVWDGLHEDDLIRNWTGDPGGDPRTMITDAGRAELYRLIGVTPS